MPKRKLFCFLVWVITVAERGRLSIRKKVLSIFLGPDTAHFQHLSEFVTSKIHWLQNPYYSVPQLFHNILISTPYFLSLCSRWCLRQFARVLPSRKIWFSLIGFMNWLSRDKMKTKRILQLDFPVGEHIVITLSQPISYNIFLHAYGTFHSRIARLTIPMGSGSPGSIYYDSEWIFTN